MNTKTTLLLFFAVVAVGVTIFVLQEKAPPQRPEVPTPPPLVAEQVQKPVLAEDLAEVTEVVIQQPVQPEWRFVRETPAEDSSVALSNWRLTAPVEGKAQQWQVEQIATRLRDLKYTVQIGPDSKGITAESAGLEPPRASITLVGKDGKKHTVHLGRNEGDTSTYVRVDDKPEIYVASPSLKGLVREKPLDYLDQQLFSITPDNVVRFAIDSPGDGGMEHIELVKKGGEWVFEAPAPGRTVADKVRRLASSFATLRVINWVEEAENPAIYGFDDDATTITATVEEKVAPKAYAGTNGEPPPAETVTKTYTVQISRTGPLGDKNKVYVRRGDEPLVGTMTKTLADTFRPNLKEWRDNRLLERDPLTARRVTLTVGEASAEFVRGQTEWSYAADNAPADRTEMEGVLNALKNTTVLNFETGAHADPARFGLDAPRGVLQLTFDGQDQPTVVRIGGFADPDTKRLVYVQVDNADTVAKIRTASADALLREPGAFRDRTLVSIQNSRLERVTIDRPVEHGLEGGGRLRVAIAQQEGTWKLVEPVEAEANSNGVAMIVAALGNLHGLSIFDAADESALARYGLDDPQVRVEISYLPPEIQRVDTNGTTTTEQPPAEQISLALARYDDQVFAQRGDRPQVVYELATPSFEAFTTVLHDTRLWRFEDSQVQSIVVEQDGKTQGFKRGESGWTFVPEADIPIDATKVTNYVLRVRDLRAERYVAYGAADLAAYGLDAPAATARIEVEGQDEPIVLAVSARVNDLGEYFARLGESSDVFTLPGDALERLKINVAEFE